MMSLSPLQGEHSNLHVRMAQYKPHPEKLQEKEENNRMDSGGSTTSTILWFPTKFIPSKEQTGMESHSWRYMHGSTARGSLYVHTFKYNNWARIIFIKKCVACTWPPNEPWYWVLDSHSVLEKLYK